MTVTINKTKLKGEITARPSKSFAHRYLIASALSNNESKISNIDFSDDITATLNCIHAYGKKHLRDFENGAVFFTNEELKNFDPVFDCKESGSTLRMFFPIAIQKYDKCSFIGSDRLMERGIELYEKIFKYILFDKNKYCIKTTGTLSPNKYELAGNISSQYISGLLFALPLLDNDSEIIITTNLESINYIMMTLSVLKKYNIEIETINFQNDFFANNITSDNKTIFKIKGNQKYIASDNTVEGDYSNIAFIDAFNYFDNNINIFGLNPDSYQSDKIYKELFDKLDKEFSEIDISNCIDLGPILIAFATLKNGARITGTSRLKIKESDRGNAMAEELRKCNAKIQVLDNEIIIEKSNLIKPDFPLSSHNDHRIAMALTLLSTAFDIRIDNSECVKKSYPKFFDDLKILGANIS